MEKLKVLDHLEGSMGAFSNRDGSSGERENSLACRSLNGVIVN
jgi:hypothetical protein